MERCALVLFFVFVLLLIFLLWVLGYLVYGMIYEDGWGECCIKMVRKGQKEERRMGRSVHVFVLISYSK